eukprot:jgi/Tetstr1/437355/TSEL_026040.t1
MGHVERFLHFNHRAEKAKGLLLLVGQHISDAEKERTWGGIFARMGAAGPGGSPASALLGLSSLDPLRAEERNPPRTAQPKMMKMLGKLMPNRINRINRTPNRVVPSHGGRPPPKTMP